MASDAIPLGWRHITIGHFHGPEHHYAKKTDGERWEARPDRAGDAGDTSPATVIVLGLLGHRREAKWEE